MRESDVCSIYSTQTRKDLDIIIDVIRKANGAGLLAEVVLDLARSKTGTIEEKAAHVLNDWLLE